MSTNTTKTRAATMDGFFDPKFPRVMEGEASYDPVKASRVERKKQAAKNIGAAFVPPAAPKSLGCSGGMLGTFAGRVEHFAAITEPPKRTESPKKNLYTSPGKKGTGFGYLGVTFGAYAKHAEDPYDAEQQLAKKQREEHKARTRAGAFRVHTAGPPLFDGNPFKDEAAAAAAKEKRGEGQEGEEKKEKKRVVPFYPGRPGLPLDSSKYSGTFDKYPSHADEPPPERKEPTHERVFRPPMHRKTRATQSVLSRNVTRHVNAGTYRTVHV